MRFYYIIQGLIWLLLLAMLALSTGCASTSKVRPATEAELRAYQIDCNRRDAQIAALKQQQEAQKLPKLENMNDSERVINGQIKSKLWALRLECQTTAKR